LAPESNDYILGVNEDERTRLLAQAELHAPEARVLLDRVGVAPGWRTIDVGCGPLGVLDLLAERVGPTGTVVGLDRDERMLAMAAQSLAERELHHVRLVQAPADPTVTGDPDVKTVLTPVQDVDAAKPVWIALLGQPTSDTPYYLGWTMEGQEVGLVPGGHRQGLVGPTPYRHVADIAATSAALVAAGGTSLDLHQCAQRANDRTTR
jgi:SAM-dependent methyltransferase